MIRRLDTAAWKIKCKIDIRKFRKCYTIGKSALITLEMSFLLKDRLPSQLIYGGGIIRGAQILSDVPLFSTLLELWIVLPLSSWLFIEVKAFFPSFFYTYFLVNITYFELSLLWKEITRTNIEAQVINSDKIHFHPLFFHLL